MKENQLLWIKKTIIIFFIGALVGFLYEVIFYYFTENRLNNAGILYGPWLPIYGTGAILISLIPLKIKKNPFLLFTFCMIITGLLEYIIGYIDLYIFNTKLWDYSGLFLNIDGFVCLRSVLTFALGGLFLVYVIEPFLEKILKNTKYKKYLNYLITTLTILFVIDIIVSNLLHRTPFLY